MQLRLCSAHLSLYFTTDFAAVVDRIQSSDYYTICKLTLSGYFGQDFVNWNDEVTRYVNWNDEAVLVQTMETWFKQWNKCIFYSTENCFSFWPSELYPQHGHNVNCPYPAVFAIHQQLKPNSFTAFMILCWSVWAMHSFSSVSLLLLSYLWLQVNHLRASTYFEHSFKRSMKLSSCLVCTCNT